MKICYINFNLNNSRDQITLMGLRENGIEVKEIYDNTRGFRKYLNISKKYNSYGKDCDFVMVGYSGAVLVILMRFLTRKKIIFNTLSSFYDSMIRSRFGGVIFTPKSIWYYIIDFFAFHFADLSFIECQSQKDLVIKVFRINPIKISVHPVGVDDKEFYFDSAIPKRSQFTVVFRGMFLPEAGADVVILAAKELERENIMFRIIGRGLLKKDIENLVKELNPSNLELITERLPIEDLRRSMLECHLSLGQLADHPRVDTTIPHKAFESMAMKIPYITGENKGVLEIIEDNKSCFVVPKGDYKALAQKIIELRNKPEKLKEVAENAYNLYKQKFTSKDLAEKIIQRIKRI